MPEYTVAAVVAPLLVIGLELAVLRTGLLRTARYWITLGIVLGFQLPVDGWLTKPHGTVVHYQDGAITGVRLLWFPVEDLGFGFALVTLTLLLWHRLAGLAALAGRLVQRYRGSRGGIQRAGRPGDRDPDQPVAGLPPRRTEATGFVPDQ